MSGWRCGQSGQVIILAVVIMLLLSIMAAVFVALVTHSLTQAGRQEDVIAAETAAESATKFIHELLLENPEYRPERPTGLSENYYTELEISRGWGPPAGSDLASAFDEMVHFVKLEPPGETKDLSELAEDILSAIPGRTLVRVRYAPRDYFDRDGDGNTAEFPQVSASNAAFDQLSRFIEITTIGEAPLTPGLTRVNNAYVPLLTPDYLFCISDYGKSETEQEFGVPYTIDIDGDGRNSGGLEDLTDPMRWQRFVGGLFSNTSVCLYGKLRFICPRPPAAPLGDRGDGVYVAGRISFDGITDTGGNPPLAPSGLPLTGYAQTDDGANVLAVGAASNDPNFPIELNPNDPNALTWLDGLGAVDASVHPARSVQRITPPNVEAKDPDSGEPQLELIAESSGNEFTNNGAPDNTARYGFGRALYVANDSDRQVFDRDLLADEWRRLGAGANSPYWQGPLYNPPGVEIVLFETHQAPQWFVDNLGNDPALPDIKIIRHPDPEGKYTPWRIPFDSAAGRFDPWARGAADTVRVLDRDNDGVPDASCWFDYPADGLIYCTGNVRISGKLAAGPYNLTVVTPGNIYVEGNLLSPSDWAGIDAEDPTNSRIALLAGENVVINGPHCALRGLRTNADVRPVSRGERRRVKYVLGPGQHLDFWFGFAGTDEEQCLLGNPQASAPATDGNVFIKLKVKGSKLSAFDMYLNGIRYDFDRSDGVGVEINPCRQMNGKVQILAIPVLRDAANQPIDLDNDGTVETPFGSPPTGLDPRPGGLNHVRIVASPEMTRPLEIYAFGVEMRTGATIPLNDTSDPPDGVEDGPMLLRRVGGRVQPALDCVVHALMYAQKGTFFIIPGEFWDPRACALDHNGDGVVDAADIDRDASAVADFAESRRWNVRLRIYGAITESYVADPGSVADWYDKWSYPLNFAAMDDGDWGLIEFRYDPGLRSNRPFARFSTLPRLPFLPVSPDLVYFGKLSR